MKRRLLYAAAILLAFLLLPVLRIEAPVSAVLLDREGELLGARVAADQQWRFPGTGLVPEKFATALIAAEDKRFRAHPGVDPLAVARAIELDLRAGRVVSGASTLTMQVVRIARGNPPRTVPEKLLEMLLALRLEVAASKDEILAMYVENAPFGGNVVGLEAAAWRYFGRRPQDLSWAEAATLAVLPNSPALVHPGRNRAELRRKRDALLERLHEAGELDADSLRSARAEPLPELVHDLPADAPHLLAKVEGRQRSSLDAALQRRASALIQRHHAALAGNGIHNAAALIVDLESGEARAWVGNVRPGTAEGSHVDLVEAARSTGSTLKPFLYASMLGEGTLLPDQLVRDLPARFGAFAPENFDHAWTGALPASQALARSRNVPAVWMLREHGVERFADTLRKMGMTTLFRPARDYGLSLVVGGAEGRLRELVGLYRDLALSVDHEELPPDIRWQGEAGPGRPRRLDPAAAWLTLRALDEVNRPGVEALWRSFRGAESVSWKTGTSQGFRDAWAIGVTPSWAVGVWVGNADGEGRPGLTGYEVAAPILFDLFDLVRSDGHFEAPPMATVEVCASSGRLAGPDCVRRRSAQVPPAGVRGPACDACRLVHLAGGEQVHGGCASPAEMTTEARFSLPPGEEWFYARQHPDYRPLPPWRAGCEPAEARLAILSPAPGAAVLVPVELDGRRGRVVFEASHRDDTVLYWHLDEAFVGSTTAPHQLALAPAPGLHRLTVVDPSGGRVQREFSVLDRERLAER